VANCDESIFKPCCPECGRNNQQLNDELSECQKENQWINDKLVELKDYSELYRYLQSRNEYLENLLDASSIAYH
jgi:hypothetical protein